MQQKGSEKRGGGTRIPLAGPEMAGKGGLSGAVLQSPQVLGLPDGKAELSKPRAKLELEEVGIVLASVVPTNIKAFAGLTKKEGSALIKKEEEGKVTGGEVSGESWSGADTDSVHSEDGGGNNPMIAPVLENQAEAMAQMGKQMVAVASLVEGQAALAGRRKEVEARGAGCRGFGRAPRTEFDDFLEDEKKMAWGPGGRSIYAVVLGLSLRSLLCVMPS